MKKKLLAALVLSMAIITPQAKAESALETAINSTVEEYIMAGNQSVTANLTPQTGDLAGRLLVINDDETATLANYFNITGNNHSGFNFQEGALALYNVNTVSGFSTTGNGGAFNMTDDADLEWYNFVDKDHLGTVTGNTATGNGGGIYSDGHYAGAVQLHGVSVTNNQAGGKGGGIYASYGVHSLFANSGAVLNFTGNTSSLGDDDIYLTNQAWMRIVSRGNGTATATVNVDNLRLDNKSEFYIVTPKADAGAGIVNIKNIELSNGSTLDFSKDYKHANTNITTLSLNGDSILNTVNNYIESNLNIGTINLTGANKFLVDANLKSGELAIDHFNTVNGGNIKLAVNIMAGANTDSGTLTLFDSGNATITGSSTQYGEDRYTFSQSALGKVSYTKERVGTLKEALADLDETSYDMPDVTVANSNLGYLAYDTNIGPRTFTINGNHGVLTTDGGEYSGIQIWPSYYGDADGSKLIIKDLDAFNGFTSKYTDGAYGHEGFGGAINAHQALLDIDGVTFSNNIATGDPNLTTKRTSGNGGAIYIQSYYDYENPENIKIKDSSFINNKAISVGPTGFVPGESLSRGGAINSLGPMDIEGTLFSGNSAITEISGGEAQGGAIRATMAVSEFIDGNDVSIDDSIFMSNVAGDVQNEGDQLLNTQGFGGAIYSYKINPTITNTVFVSNMAQAAGDRESEFDPGHYLTAKSQGGAIYVDPERSLNTLTISDSTFAMNKTQNVKSVDNGDGTYTLSTDGVDQSQSLGGAIALMTYPSGSGMPLLTVNITDTDFLSNTAGNGGAIFNVASELNIKDSSFKGNRASIEGGAIHNGSVGNSKAILNLDNVTFTANYARTGTPEDIIKNDINNYAIVNFVGSASTLDGGIFGYYNGTTNFMLDDGNSMDIGNKTFISQRFVNIAEGTTLNVDSAHSLNVYSQLENNGNLNIKSGWLLPSNATNGNEYINNGTMTLGSVGQDVDVLHTKLTNNGTIQGASADNQLVNNGSTITNNADGEINMNIANSPFAAGVFTEEDLQAYASGTLDEVADADLIAIIEDSGYGAAIDAGTLDTSNLGASTFGNLINYGTITGNIGNKHGEIQNLLTVDENEVVTATGVINGDIDNKDGTLYNDGIINGNITDNRDGVVGNNTGATINGNIGDDTTNGGEVYNDGTINGDVITKTTSNYHIAKFYNNPNGVVNGRADVVGAKSIASNNGTINTLAAAADQYVYNEGTYTNNGTIYGGLENDGDFANVGIVDGTDSDNNVIVNNADATVINAGTMTFAEATNSGNFINGVNPLDPEEIVADATITTTDSDNGFVNEADATLLNYGVVEGTVDNEGTFTNNGIVNGNTSNDNGGIVTNNGTMNGYADNFGETSVFVNNNIIDNSQAEEEQYVINEGSYTNNGTIIGGVENEDGTFYNNGTIDSTNTDSDYIVNDEGQFINNGTVTSAVVYSDGQLVNGANPTDPTETNPNATINANIINDGTVYNAGTIVGDVSNETPMSFVYLYEGGTIKGNVGDEENSNGILGLIGGNGTVDGDVNVQTLGMAQLTDTPVGELHITGDVNSQSFFSSGGALNLQNGEASVANLGDIILAGNTKLLVDVDLKNNKVDALNGTINEAYSNPDAKFEISNMNIASDSKKVGKTTLDMFNGDEESRAALKGRLTASKGLKVNSPIFNYAGKYDAENGTLALNKSFNPSVMAGPVAAQMGGYLAQLSAYSEAFGNMDSYMLMSSEQRLALKHKNHYAASDANLVYDPTMLRQERADAWFRPYASFESVNLKNGPKVSNTMYGTFAGGDSRMISLGHGWDAVFGGYVGYNGSHQTFDGVSVYQNGGTLGGTGMFYKGNFFTGLTANVGANAGEASTMFGRENFTMLMTGVASKTGYNFELADRKFIIQPSMLMSYSFVNTFDYTNAAGVKIESDPLNALQLQPELKFIGNLKNGWQPYASVAMVWNVMDKAKFSANDVALPEMSVKPFVKYGVGVKKTWGERFSGFFQTYLTNGGRNGVGLQAGFTWALGKAPEKTSDMKLHKAPEMKKTKISLNNSNVH